MSIDSQNIFLQNYRKTKLNLDNLLTSKRKKRKYL